MDGILNFRDVGGLPTVDGHVVRRGRVFRSGHLASATDGDLAELERLGVRTVVDLRGPADIASDGENRLPAGAQVVLLPMAGEESASIRTVLAQLDGEQIQQHFGDGKALAMMLAGSESMVTDPQRCVDLGRLLRLVADAPSLPVVIHCSAGKDRTGWAASLLLTLLGVDEEAVIAHYLESNLARGADAGRWTEAWDAAGIDWSPMEPFFGVRRELAEASLRAVEREWGGFDRYVRDGLGVDDATVEALRAELLDPA